MCYGKQFLEKGGTVVNAHHEEVANVYVEDGIIVAVKPHINVGDDVTVIDAVGKFVMPSIDPHVHLAMDFMGTQSIDDFFNGQAAALAGGTTMHIDFVLPVDGSLMAGFESYEKKSRNSCMDYGSIWRSQNAMKQDKLFQVFSRLQGSFMISDELLLQGFKKCKSLGALAMVHAENRDAVYEGQKRMIELVHVMSIDAMEEVAKARKSVLHLAGFLIPLQLLRLIAISILQYSLCCAEVIRLRVIGETVVSALVLDDSWLWHPDFSIAAK
ncbi:hypothetical protein G4B88_004271 [Cannabis sativa]|uniref:Amidohydrolase-related domain-containing protein n=1 Tax=Cannabis sativa TaxID=3483 RepID=A0A7J6EBN4_CANSA|nr:hypothetical protein G4B88_004271 [Cannabis sativa]